MCSSRAGSPFGLAFRRTQTFDSIFVLVVVLLFVPFWFAIKKSFFPTGPEKPMKVVSLMSKRDAFQMCIGGLLV